MPHVGINAQLLSRERSYRAAGIHGYIHHLLAHLPDADSDLRYTVFVDRGDPPPHARLSVRRSPFRTTNPYARILWEQALQPFALARAGVDLHHGTAYALPLAWTGPAVVTILDLTFIRHPELLRPANRLYLRTITRLSARRARRVIAISQATADEIHALLGVPADRIDVTHLGVSHKSRPLPTAEVDRFRRANDLPQRFILYLGTLEPRKNITTLLHAFAALPQQDVALVLVGGQGWLYHAIDATIEELGLQPRIIRPGYVADELLPLWYNAATVFAYPSLYEGFGLPILEAMACGTPVVAADTTSLPEAVGRDGAGLLVPPGDVDAWTHALSALLDDEDRRRDLSERGRQRAATFTWAQTARQTVASYRRALSGE